MPAPKGLGWRRRRFKGPGVDVTIEGLAIDIPTPKKLANLAAAGIMRETAKLYDRRRNAVNEIAPSLHPRTIELRIARMTAAGSAPMIDTGETDHWAERRARTADRAATRAPRSSAATKATVTVQLPRRVQGAAGRMDRDGRSLIGIESRIIERVLLETVEKAFS